MAFEPTPCTSCGGSGNGGADAENNILCDTLADGTIVGTALAVYTYDENGSPVGAPTFVDPVTGLPYVAQGILMVCPGETGCNAPQQFCFSSTATTDQPGRQFDVVLPLAQGFAVQSMLIDLVEYPLNVVWDVADGDASDFTANLQAAISTKFPGQTVTVAPLIPILGTCGAPESFTIHIECRLVSESPSLVQFKYNGGQDLVQNPAYNETPPLNPPGCARQLRVPPAGPSGRPGPVPWLPAVRPR